MARPKADASAAAETIIGKNDAVSLLKADHRKVEKLFAQFEETEDDSQKKNIVKQICMELIVHTKLEEEIFYPACREKDVDDDLMDEAQVEHDGAKVLIGDLLRGSPNDEYYDAKVKTLSEYIRHHVSEEEKPRSGIFAKAQKAGLDMAELGQKLQTRKTELMAQGEALTSEPPQPRSFTINQQAQQENSMSRYSNDRDRDDQGRFSNEDDHRGGSRGYQSRGSNRDRDDQGRFTSDDDSNYGGQGYSSRGGQSRDDEGRFAGGGSSRYGSGGGHGGGYGGGGPDRDERGRFTSDEDNNNYGGRGSFSRGSRSSQGQGWHGDSEGHSQASERGWENRGGGRSQSSGREYDDDNNYRGRDSSRGSQGGPGRGWSGDSEGHSRAAQEGWENRGYSGRQSSGRDDDDSRRGSRGESSRGGSRGSSHEGHGGWFGDSEGHSRAAREGWRDR